MSTNHFGVSLKKELLGALDKHAAENQYFNCYQTNRSLINSKINSSKRQCNNFVAGSIKLDYAYPETNTLNSMTGLKNNHHNTILSSLYFLLENDTCLSFSAIKEKAFILNQLANKPNTVKYIHR
jgi:metal-responsive CopG/Arc/MetJ family transcriptional regulator